MTSIDLPAYKQNEVGTELVTYCSINIVIAPCPMHQFFAPLAGIYFMQDHISQHPLNVNMLQLEETHWRLPRVLSMLRCLFLDEKNFLLQLIINHFWTSLMTLILGQ